MKLRILSAIALALLNHQGKTKTIPDIPLLVSLEVEPNIMMMLDDSGSMHWEVMPDDILFVYYMFPRSNYIYCENKCGRWASGLGGSYFYGDYQNRTVDTDENNRFARLLRSPTFNKIYYNPKIRYYPWSNPDGTLWPNADPKHAYHNPADPSKGYRNLTVKNCYQNSKIYWKMDNGRFLRTRSKKCIFPATYFIFDASCDPTKEKWKKSCYHKVEIKPGKTYKKYPERSDCKGNICTYQEEIQNFANWYSYYRSRILSARAAIGRAFSLQGSNIRVGFGAINKGDTRVDGVRTKSVILGVRKFEGADRIQFFDVLYNHPVPVAWTPLRGALDYVGRYFKRGDDKGPWSDTPGQAGGKQFACRQNYTVLMTDGYWNYGAASGGARANNDGTNGPWQSLPPGSKTPEDRPGFECTNGNCRYKAGPPFKDGRGNTLADVAMYYWKNDLRPDMENLVPTNAADPAFWQHMVTFGVGFGVVGSIDPEAAFLAAQTGDPINWPNPLPSNATYQKIDDLLHAAVNSRGGFFSAANPEELAKGLTETLQEIANRKGSLASLTLTGTQVSSDTLVFQPKFQSGSWSGELEAHKIVNILQGNTSSPVWRASEKLPPHSARRIYVTIGGTTLEFRGPIAGLMADLVAYLRGDQSQEIKNGGTFRNREHPLGDIIHSTPFYLEDNETVFVGANDGMLHAFDARTGVELFGYIPSAVVSKLAQLADPKYQHKYYVDGNIDVSRREDIGRNILVATLGRGGKGLFALDVTDPRNFGPSNFLWEYFNPLDQDLGYMVGEPIISKMNNGKYAAIVANGYLSTSGKAVLYIFDIETGSLIKKIDTGVAGDNGLSTPALFDQDGDGDIDFAYAGDLQGNVWKFDLSSSDPNSWSLAYRLFQAKDRNGQPQPITSPITVVRNPVYDDPNFGKIYIFFGTGSYIFTGDRKDKSFQTIYGLIDEGVPISGRGELKERKILSVETLHGKKIRVFEKAKIGDMEGKRGWYIDLSSPGERVVDRVKFYMLIEPVLIVSSRIPSEDPCKPGGEGFVNAIAPFSGGSVIHIFFDVNEDSSYNQKDRPDRENYVGSLGTAGMPTEPQMVCEGKECWIVVGTTEGEIVKIPTPPIKRGRWMWREIVIE